MVDYKENYKKWLSDPVFDEETKEELRNIALDEKEIEDRFYKELTFGTAGLRGVIGAGTNRMNIYTVRKATQGLANYILKVKGKKSVAIAYDCRHMSRDFAREAALCLAANGIKAYIFESLRPTPELSFAVRYLSCTAGINITASHNPPEYNGYKVYWEDGAQITPPNDTGIMNEVFNISSYADCKVIKKEEAIEKNLYEVIGKEIDDAYIGELKKLVLDQDAIDAESKNIKIVYSPLHGTGLVLVTRILRELGFENVYVVPEQEKPDGSFPTVSYPNPEAKEAFELGLKLAKKVDADIVLATDPDADRLGVYVKDAKTGNYNELTGNMSGCLLADYEIRLGREKGIIPKDASLIKSIVTTNMADAIARENNVSLIEVLTGFKYIGKEILRMEEEKKGYYAFGFEESYGCLIGTHARDKDACVATMALCEACAYYKQKGLTLWDAMISLFEKYGYYKDSIKALTLKGVSGDEKIKKVLSSLRLDPPKEFGGLKVIAVRDYEKGERVDLVSGKTSKTTLPKSNVLYYELEKDGWVCARPSGTEPKIKFYYGVCGVNIKDANDKASFVEKSIDEILNKILG